MSDEKKSFLGVPIEGDIIRGETRVAQRPLEEFAPILQAVLDDPTVNAVRWTQYTPHFMDGDPCIFSASGLEVQPDRDTQLAFDIPVEEYDSWDEDTPGEDNPWWVNFDYPGEVHEEWLGDQPRRWVDGRFIELDYTGPDKARYDRLSALSTAIQSGAFDNVLLEHFGDHAVVTVRKDKIEVSFYEHD